MSDLADTMTAALTVADAAAHTSHDGAASLLRRVYPDRILYDEKRDEILVYMDEDGLFAPDPSHARLHHYLDLLEATVYEPARAAAWKIAEGSPKGSPERKQAQQLAGFIAKLNSAGSKADVAKSIKAGLEHFADSESMNTYAELLPFANGVVDLRTGILRPHSPKYRFTHGSKVRFPADMNAAVPASSESETVKNDLATFLPDPATRQTVQDIIGQSLTGHNGRAVWYWIGAGRNWKSMLELCIRLTLGSLSYTTNSDFYLMSRGDRSAYHDSQVFFCFDKRAILNSEATSGRLFSNSKIKEMTEAYVNAKKMRHDGVEVRLQGTKIVSRNAQAAFDAADPALFARFRVVPWNVTIEDAGIPENQRYYDDVLAPQAPAIAALFVRFAREYLANCPDMKPRESPEIIAASEQLARDADPLTQWIEEAVAFVPGACVSVRDLWVSAGEYMYVRNQADKAKILNFLDDLPGVTVGKAESTRTFRGGNGTSYKSAWVEGIELNYNTNTEPRF